MGSSTPALFRNGNQYFIRVDKYLKNDRIYGSFFRTTLDTGGPPVIPQFSTTNHTWQRAFQVNYTHTFSPTTLNEAIFASEPDRRQKSRDRRLHHSIDLGLPASPTLLVSAASMA